MVGKFKLKDSLLYSQLKEEESKTKSAQPKKQPKPAKVESESEEDSSDEEEDDDEDESNDEAEPAVLSKKDLRQLKKKLSKQGLTLEDLNNSGDEEEEDDDEDVPKLFDTKKLLEINDTDSESEFEEFANKREKKSKKAKKDQDEEEQEEEAEDVDLEDAELDDDADVIPFQKLTINNKAALQQALHSIQLPKSGLKFIEHLSVTSSFAQVSKIKDVFDDYARELSFVEQAKEAAELARTQLKKDGIPFSRPTDYFAEMIKSDEHMDRIKQKMIDEQTDKLARLDARRQRELKKFGKKVQTAKLQERQKDKRDTLEKIQSLKRKRAGNEIGSEDFDIALEEATAHKSEFGGRGSRNGKSNPKRQAKDQKYGFGGQKKFKKSNDAESSGDMGDYNRRVKANKAARQGGAKPRRPGKSKRQQRR